MKSKYIQNFEEFFENFYDYKNPYGGIFKVLEDDKEFLDKNKTYELITQAKDHVSTCVEILQSLIQSLQNSEITVKPLESSLSQLTNYLAGLEKAQETLSKSNIVKL